MSRGKGGSFTPVTGYRGSPLRSMLRNYREVVSALIEIPEHHYFRSEPAGDWLLAWTTEGDVDLLRGIVSTED